MRDQYGAELTPEAADRVAVQSEQAIEDLYQAARQRPNGPGDWKAFERRLAGPDRDRLAHLRRRRDSARAHSEAVRAEEQRERKAQARRQREADDDVIDATPARMQKLAQVIEDGRASAIFMAELVEHIRRVQAAQVASEQLQRVAANAESAAGRRGREVPQEPQVEPLPKDTETGLALFNSVVRDKLLRESASRTR